MSYTFKYETHCHTSESSSCGAASAVELIRGYKNKGYTGVVITDHFYNGNCSISTDLPWNSWVKGFCKGYNNALKEAKKLDLDLFFAFELSYLCADFLIYGLSPEFLIKNPDIPNWTLDDFYKNSRIEGGYIIHAHPFREAHYIDENRLFPKSIDAVEVINRRNLDSENEKALVYAEQYNFIKTSGNDAHNLEQIKGGGIMLKERINNIDDLITCLKTGDFKIA